MNEGTTEAKQGKKEDVIFAHPEGANYKVGCITIQRESMVVNGNTVPRVFREIKPVNGIYRLAANASYYDEQKAALEDFAKRHGLRKVVPKS